jgi:hypothetical protein
MHLQQVTAAPATAGMMVRASIASRANLLRNSGIAISLQHRLQQPHLSV